MESSGAALLKILSVISVIISNTYHGSYGAEVTVNQQQLSQNMQPNAAGGTPAGYPQNATPQAQQAYQPAANGYAPALQGYPPMGAPPSGYPMMGAQSGYPMMGPPSGYPMMGAPSGFPMGASGFPQGGQSFPLGGGYSGAMQGYRPMGIDLNNGFVAETLNAISKVSELSIIGVKLPNRDIKSLSDPFCITYLRPFNATSPDAWVEYHQTETIWDDLNPLFAKKPLIPPSFGDKYTIRFKLFDADMNSNAHDDLGYVEVNLKELLSKEMMSLKLQVTKRFSSREVASRTSKVVIKVEELIDNNNEVHFAFHGSNIEKKDTNMWGKKINSDPYLMIFKETGTNGHTLVHRTEYKKDEETPVWLEFTLHIKSLCNGDENRNLKFVCYDWDSKGGHDLIGDFSTTLKGLKERRLHGEVFDLKNVESSRKNKIAGHIHVDKLETIQHPTFTQFISSGLQINVNIVIDFSSANGDLKNPASLHFLPPNPGTMNKYQQAINSVVTILEAYDFNKTFPTFGFAARNSKTGPVSPVFQLDPDSPECAGVYGVIEAYRKCVSKPDFTLGTPVRFAPVIQKVVQSIKNPPPTQEKYFILLLFTAGEISDFPETETAIKNATTLPLSIIIVGVGDATGNKFDQMEKLDGDLVQKSPNNNDTRVTRDIVQFVPLSKYVSNFVDSSGSLVLAKELLAELPNQVIRYMELRSFNPPVMQNQQFMYGGQPMMGGMGGYPGSMPPQYMQSSPYQQFQNPGNFAPMQQLYGAPQQWSQAGGYGMPGGAPSTDPNAQVSSTLAQQYSMSMAAQGLTHAPSSLTQQFSMAPPTNAVASAPPQAAPTAQASH